MQNRIYIHSLFLLLIFFSATLSAETYSFNLTEQLWNGWDTKQINGVAWTLSGVDDTDFGFSQLQGHQFGSSTHPNEWISLKTSDIQGSIYLVKVTASGSGNVDAQMTVSVGEEVFSPEAKSLFSLSFAHEFLGTAQGELNIFIQNNGATELYIKSVVVEYLPIIDPRVTIEEIALSFECEIDASQEYALTIKGEYLEADIAGELSGEDAEKFQFNFAENFDFRKGGLIFLEYKPDFEEDVHIASLWLSSEGVPTKEIELMGVSRPITSVLSPKEDAKVWTEKNQIHFYANLNDTVELIDLSGKKILQTTAVEGLNTIHIQASGVLIIKINQSASKIIM